MQFHKECIYSQGVRRKEQIRLMSGIFEVKLGHMTALFFPPLNISIFIFLIPGTE